MIQVLCEPHLRTMIIERIISETTSLGVRFYTVHRKAVSRETVEIETVFGRLAAKRVAETSGQLRIVPEFEACRKIAESKGIALRVVYEQILRSISMTDSDGV